MNVEVGSADRVGLSATCNERRASSSLNFAGRPGDPISPQLLGFSGVAGFLFAWWLAQYFRISDNVLVVVLFLVCTTLPLVTLSLFSLQTHLRHTSGLSSNPKGSADIVRVGIKLLGLVATLGALFFAYWLCPEYSRDFYNPVWEILSWTAFPAAVLTVVYFFWADRRMIEPHDAYWAVGMGMLGRWNEVDGSLLKEHALAWIVKGFFLPLMLAGAAENIPAFSRDGLVLNEFALLYSTFITFIFSVDVTFGVIGYCLTLRALDSHVRSTDSTPLGWVSAVICYTPFSNFVWKSFLGYKGELRWHEWLEPYPVLYVSWGFTILVLFFIYIWATVSFGCRFSNLTHRGIIIDGPYRFIRHPAYLSKNIGWWLIYIPFAAHAEWQSALKGCICLFLTNVIYFIRAKTEERHLMNDPAYTEYCRWVDRNGLVAQTRSLFSLGREANASRAV